MGRVVLNPNLTFSVFIFGVGDFGAFCYWGCLASCPLPSPSISICPSSSPDSTDGPPTVFLLFALSCAMGAPHYKCNKVPPGAYSFPLLFFCLFALPLSFFCVLSGGVVRSVSFGVLRGSFRLILFVAFSFFSFAVGFDILVYGENVIPLGLDSACDIVRNF